MNEIELSQLAFNYEILSYDTSEYYKDVIFSSDLGDEATIKINGSAYFVYPVKIGNKLYAIPSNIVEEKKMPIRIAKSLKQAYNKKVYHFVDEYRSCKIKAEKKMIWRKLVDSLGNFKHSNPDEFKVFIILCLSLYLGKGFARVVSEASFGKNSINTILKILMGDIAIFNPRTVARVEYSLINKELVLDELTNLKGEQRDLMQEVLLKICDWSPTYEKGSMGKSNIGTKNQYDISKTSVLIMYNIMDYYIQKNQGEHYFDNCFQYAVLDRIMPFYFNGVLDSQQFQTVSNPKDHYEDTIDLVVDTIRTLKYYQTSFLDEGHNYTLDRTYKFSKSGRMEKTFKQICHGIGLYAESETEYRKLVAILAKAHFKYKDMIKAGTMNMEGTELPPKAEKVDKNQKKLETKSNEDLIKELEKDDFFNI